MARPSGEKVHNNGQWTPARFNSFIKSLLRSGTVRWGPIQSVRKKANIRRGFYLCADCGPVAATIKDSETGKRVKNVFVDHIKPIVPPETGFTTWDEVIGRMFCEEDNLQVLCKSCHDEKCKEERAIAARYRAERKANK